MVGCLCGLSAGQFAALRGFLFPETGLYYSHMDWTNWQTYVALAVVLVTLGVFASRGLKAWLIGSDKNCCGGGCGCGVAKGRKKTNR
jgi:hypothetical protein